MPINVRPSKTFDFSPVIDDEEARFFPGGMAVKEQQRGPIFMTGQGDAPIGVEDFAAGGVREMRGVPDIIKLIGSDGGEVADDGPPGTGFIIGKVDGIGWTLDPNDF